MDIVKEFKNHLLTQKNPPSHLTIKNYLSDVRRFFNWFENTYQTPFNPQWLNKEVICRYQNEIQLTGQSSLSAASSIKRYLSSLRKFTSFLEESGAINTNPFSLLQQVEPQTDPFFFKEFKNYLFTEHASRLTIKNYLADLRQFIDWLEQVTSKGNSEANQPQNSNLLQSIDNYVLEQYKTRLLNEAKLSPISINRKLSSLRRYVRWLNEKGILEDILIQPYSEPENKKVEIKEENPPVQVQMPELPLTVLQGMSEEDEKIKTNYSRFAPFRLMQKTTKAINLGTDLLFFGPIAHVAEAIHYSIWKSGKKTIFAPVKTILKTSSYIPTGVSVKTIIPKASSIMPPRSANLASVLDKIQQYRIASKPETVHNFAKALYAPLKLSTQSMDWKQKVLYHIRYTRPNWYRNYHSFAFVHYLHIGILIMATVISGATLFITWYGTGSSQKQAVLAAQDTAPPRTLSFQGRLLDNTDTPITAETPLRFALYNSPAASGAALLWQETQDIKPDQNGHFTATLGERNRLDQNVFTNNPSLYIGLTVGNNQELTPRQQIPTTEYAANSQTVEGLPPITDNPDIAQNVLLALDSSGNLTIGGNSSHTFQATGGQFSIIGQTLSLTTNSGSNGDIKIAPDGSGIIDLEKPIQNISNYTGPSGIPGALEVDDLLSVFATSSSQSALTVNQNGTGEIISGKSHGTDKFTIDTNGNEFIKGNLILDGDTINTNSTVFDIAGSSVRSLSIGDHASIISLGGSSGITSINNSLSVQGSVTANGLITANAGLTISSGQKLTLPDFSPNGIPFINGNNQMVQDAGSFSWDDANKILNVFGTMCVQDSSTTCNASPGTIYAASYQAAPADLAENYVSSQQLQPGNVVTLEGQGNTEAIRESTTPYQKELIGIISTKPGITLNSDAKADSTHLYVYPVALQGRVPVKISSINGAIKAGDNITSSSIPGVAMDASGSGQIIGKALESYTDPNPNDVGQIMVFVNLSSQTSPTAITDSGNIMAASESATVNDNTTQTMNQPMNSTNLAEFLSNIAGTIQLGAVQVQTLTTQSLSVATDNITIGGETLKDYITQIVDQIVEQRLNKHLAQIPQKPQILSPVASNSAQLADQNISQSIIPTQNASQSAAVQTANNGNASPAATVVYNIYNSIATQSAEAATISATPTISPIPTADDTQLQASDSGNIDSENIDTNTFEPAASLSGQLQNVPNLQASFGTFNQGLVALGPTSLTDVGVQGTISVNNNLKITADAINTIGSNLNIEPLRQGNILFMGGLVAIDTQGNLQVNGNAVFSHNVAVKGELAAGIIAPIPNNDLIINLKNKADKTASSLIITNATGSGVLQINQSGDLTSSGDAKFNSVASNGFSIIRGAQADTSMTETVANGSAGTGVISAYETQRTIITQFVTAHSLIYITPTSNTDTVTPYLARQTIQDPNNGSQGSFTVEIPTSITKDIGFNWWIVN